MTFNKKALWLICAALIAYLTYYLVSQYVLGASIYNVTSDLDYYSKYAAVTFLNVVVFSITSLTAFAFLKWRKVQNALRCVLFMGVNISLLTFAIQISLYALNVGIGLEWRTVIILSSYVGLIFLGDWIFNSLKISLKRKSVMAVLITLAIFAIPNILLLIF